MSQEQNTEHDIRVLKMETLREDQLKAIKISSFAMRVMKECIRAFEQQDMETADAHEQSRYYDALRKMFNEDELEILSQICSSNNNEVTAGFRNMLKLEVHRRHIVAYAVKKNSTGAD